MSKLVTYTIKIEDDKRDLMRKFCEESGIKMQKFFGNAIEHEVNRERMKEEFIEDIEAINEYKNDKHKVMYDEKSIKKRLGL